MRRCLERVLLICGWFVLAVPLGLSADPHAMTYNSVTARNEIRRLEPANGQTTLLNGFTFDSGDWIRGTFVLDAAVGTLCAVSSTNTLYTFSATTGAILSTVPLDMSLRIIDLELRDGNTLLGIAYNSKTSKFELWSVSPIIGQATLLNSFTFDEGYLECGFVADRRGGRVYAISWAETLYEFDLYTGAVRSTVPLDTSLDALVLRDANTLLGITYNYTTQRHEIRSVSRATGHTSVLNTLQFDSGDWKSLAVDRALGRLYMVSGNDTLYQFDLATGAILSMAPLGVSIQELVGDADTLPTPAPQDFDGDGKTDPTVFRPSTGTWYQLRSSTGAGHDVAWGIAGDVPVPADYDGDRKTDPAVYRPSSGAWYVLRSTTGTGIGVTWGEATDVPVPADYDGDGKADVAVFRPSTGVWYIIRSSTNTAVAVAWGTTGDVPVPADFDGDGEADPTVFRPSTGTWYELRSLTGSGFGVMWGQADDVPLAGDYDGDGRADPTVYRPTTGSWYELRSTTGTGFGVVWGTAVDGPIVGDYDGDGRADPTVFRPSSSCWWFQLRSATGTGYGVMWGVSGDWPTSVVAFPVQGRVTISGPTWGRANTLLGFTATVTPWTIPVSGYRFEWGDGTAEYIHVSDTRFTAVHAYPMLGSHTVTVTVTTASGDTLTAQTVIAITP